MTRDYFKRGVIGFVRVRASVSRTLLIAELRHRWRRGFRFSQKSVLVFFFISAHHLVDQDGGRVA